jgi:hypothetical protein
VHKRKEAEMVRFYIAVRIGQMIARWFRCR